jgi:hypothetical protein
MCIFARQILINMENKEPVQDFPPSLQRKLILVVLSIVVFSIYVSLYNRDKERTEKLEKNNLIKNEHSNNSNDHLSNDDKYNRDSFLLQKIQLFDNSLDFIHSTKIDGSLYSLNQVTDLYEEGWNYVNKAINSDKSWLVEAASILKSKLENSQNKILPKWRSEYVEGLKYKLSYENIEVSYYNNTLNLKGYFYNESDINEMFLTLRNFCVFSRINKVVIHNLFTKYKHTNTYFEGKDTDPY